jgi:hypothetical protein
MRVPVTESITVVSVDTWKNPTVLNKSTYEAVSYAEYEAWKNEMKGLETERIEEGDVVYFEEGVVFPKKKFKEYYKTCKIVNNIEKATCVILNTAQFIAAHSHFWCHNFFKLKSGEYINDYNEKHFPAQDIEPGVYKFYYQGTEIIKAARYLVLLTNEKKLVDVKDISFDSGLELDQESYERIGRMLGSSDDELKNMAMRMLTGYAYTTQKHRIALLLHTHWGSWEQNRNKRINIEVKSLLKKIELDFPRFRWTQNDNSYWFETTLQYPEDEVVQGAFSAWVRKHLNLKGDEGTYKLTRV